jgi:tRNA A37 threonylcarbamoyladenosine dehydratase
MSQTTIGQNQPITSLTVADLRKMIVEIVRQVVREETRRDYYVNADGIKVLYAEAATDPDYARELNEDYQAIARGETPLVDSVRVEKELRDLGVPL